jgi:hypothetical protein
VCDNAQFAMKGNHLELQKSSGNRERLGQIFMVLAWLSQSFLIMTFMLVIGAHLISIPADADVLWVVFGSLPFFLALVAAVSTIPLVCVLFQKSSILWRSFIGIVLIAFLSISYEMMLNCFERQWRAMPAQTIKHELDWARELLSALEMERERAAGQSDLDRQISESITRETEIRYSLSKAVQGDQIYRFAQKWYGVEDMADLNESQAMNVALVWFGVLSFLLTFIGMFFATVSLVIRR